MDKERVYRDVCGCAKVGDVRGAFKGLVSLLGLRNELPRVIGFLIDNYLGSVVDDVLFWDRSARVNGEIIKTYSKVCTLPKRQLVKNAEFQDAFAYLVGLMLRVRESTDKGRWTKAIGGVDALRLKRLLEPTLVTLEVFKECSIVTKLFRKSMSIETARLFDALYHYMRRNEKKQVQLLVKYILGLQSITFDRVPMDCELFTDVKDDCKADVAWYVWWFLIAYSKKSAKAYGDSHWRYVLRIVESSFSLYKACYTKRSRDRRVQVVYPLVYMMMSEHIEDCEGVACDGWEVLKDAFCSSTQELTVAREAMPHGEKVAEEESRTGSTSVDNLRYLDCVIYEEYDE